MNEILCIGGPYDKIIYKPHKDKYMTNEERAGYYQYRCEWHRQAFVWIWHELLGPNLTPEYFKPK